MRNVNLYEQLREQIGENAESLHHAYLITNISPHEGKDEVRFFIEESLGFPCTANPDFECVERDVFSIEDSRMLRERAVQGAVAHDKKLYLIAALSMTREAQNALLKLFEDTPPRTHFFIIAKRAEALLPTLRSRLFVVSLSGLISETPVEPKAFLAANGKERMEMVKPLITRKDKAETEAFLSALERELQHALAREKEMVQEIYPCVMLCRRYINDQSSSVKILLEYLAATAPVVQL